MLGLSGSHELEAESKVGRSRDLSDAKSGVNQLGIKIASGIFDWMVSWCIKGEGKDPDIWNWRNHRFFMEINRISFDLNFLMINILPDQVPTYPQ